MNTIARTNSRHTNGVSPVNTNGHAVLTETIPVVQVSRPDGPEALTLNGVSRTPDRDLAAEAEAAPGGSPEGEPEQPPASALMDWYARFRERIPPRRYDWPAEAERSGERPKHKQAMAVGLLVLGMTVTAAAGQLGVDRGTIYRWLKDPIFVAELEARRSELVDSLLDLHMLGHRIGMGKLLELVESNNESLALRAATTLVTSGQRAYQSIDEKKLRERLEDHLGILGGFKV
jgi:transposase-like protein